MASSSKWKDRTTDFIWAVLSSPSTLGIYIGLALVFAFLASARTGVPAYIFMAVGFLLVIFVDPPERLARSRERWRRSQSRHYDGYSGPDSRVRSR
ncbi:putative membrane protein YdfJ with MMPL/SSD domain [Ensifer mexicanus]|nr:putative membrane protein YdfJ with MMPL/SSD domain [Sinorhizobium mexicanum]